MVMSTQDAPRQRQKFQWVEIDVPCVVEGEDGHPVNSVQGRRYKLKQHDAVYLQNANRAHFVNGPAEKNRK